MDLYGPSDEGCLNLLLAILERVVDLEVQLYLERIIDSLPCGLGRRQNGSVRLVSF